MKPLLVLACLIAFVPPLGAMEITFRERARCGGEWIRIRDVALVKAEPEELAMLEEMAFGAAPADGSSRLLDAEYLSRRLEQFGLKRDHHRVSIPASGVLVESADTRDRRSEVELELETLLASRLKGVSRVDVSLEDPQGLLAGLPAGLLSVEILSDKFLPEYSSRTPLHLRVHCQEEGVSGRFMAHVRLFRMEVGALRRIGTRVDIQERDVEIRECECLPGQLPGFTDIAEVVGCKASRLVPEGTRLAKADVLAKTLVRKGDYSILEGGERGLSVSLSAKALTEGREGEVILFEAPGGQRMKARIISKQRASIVGQADVTPPETIRIGGGS
ncbi:MAG: flagella basal body P-ring formation protein FlgA [Planctomycetota bacterium]